MDMEFNLKNHHNYVRFWPKSYQSCPVVRATLIMAYKTVIFINESSLLAWVIFENLSFFK